MNADLSAIFDLVNAAFPELGTMKPHAVRLSPTFNPPVAVIEVEKTGQRGHTLTSDKVTAEAGIVIHYPKKHVNGEWIYEPISAEPFINVLRKEKYQFRGKTAGLFIDIDQSSLDLDTGDSDRLTITFEFEYIQAHPKNDVPKINTFEVEGADIDGS